MPTRAVSSSNPFPGSCCLPQLRKAHRSTDKPTPSTAGGWWGAHPDSPPGALLVGFHCCGCSVTQSCPTLCDPMACSMPGLLDLHHLPEGFSLARFIFRIKTSQKPLFPNQNQCRLITCNKYLLHLRNNMVRKSNSLLQREKAVFSLPTCKQVFSCCFATPGTVATRLLCPWSGDQEGKQTDSGGHSTKTGHIRQNLDP